MKITALPLAGPIDGEEDLPLVQGGQTVRLPVADHLLPYFDRVDMAVSTAQGLLNFRALIADGVADFPVGSFFASGEGGALRLYERIAAAPFYLDMGDNVAPLTKALLGGPAGAAELGYRHPALDARRRPAAAKLDELPVTPADFAVAGDTPLLRLQRFCSALGNGVHGALDADYTIPSQLVIGDRSDFKLFGYGYTIKLADGAATGYGGSALYLSNCTDFEIIDLIGDGNRANRVPAEDPAHVIVIDKCHRWKFTRVQANNGTCDGFIIYAGSGTGGSGVGGAVTLADCPTDWIMEDCIAINNYRQGCSVIEGFFGKFRGGRYGLTSGLWDIAQGPCAGIDIEPDNNPGWVQNRVANIDIDDVLFDQNQGPGLLITRVDGVKNIRVRNCIFDRNRKAAIETVADNVDIIDAKVMGFDTADFTANPDAPDKRGAIDVGFQAGPTRIIGPTFTNIDNSGAGNANPCIYVHGAAAAGVEVSGVRTDGSASDIASLHGPHVVLRDSVIDVTGAVEGTHLTFLGNYPQMTNVTLIGVYQRAAFFSGTQPRIRDNSFHVRVADHTAYVVDTSDSTQPEIARNRIRHAADVETYGFGIPAQAIVIDNWVVNNLSTDAFIFAGAPLMKRGNMRISNPQSETALTP